MKVKFKNIEPNQGDPKLRREYEILAFGEIEEIQIFLIANDQLTICEYDQNHVIITDNNLEAYTDAPFLNNGHKFLVREALLKFCSHFKNYEELKTNHIWNKSKIARFFTTNRFEIPNLYNETILNETYKLNLIEGYILSLNNYISIKHKSCYSEEFVFNKNINEFAFIDKYLDNEYTKIETFDIGEYKPLMLNFLSETIYLTTPNEPESAPMILEFFKLIDSIFMFKIETLKRINTFYDDVIEIKYGNYYYQINKVWSS